MLQFLITDQLSKYQLSNTMGCITSSNHRKKYLQDSPEHQQQNFPPENVKLSTRINVKRRKDSTQIRKNQKSQTSQQKIKPIAQGTRKHQYEIDKRNLRKFSGHQSERFSNKSTQRQKKGNIKTQNSKAATKKSTRTIKEEQDKINKQQEKILQILKRSQKISRVYRKVCQRMMQHNQEQFQQQEQAWN